MPAPSSSLVDAEDHEVAARAAALVNPASGLANDYLNVFNEIVMLIDLLPAMPALAEDIAAWSPIPYREYFARSTLAGRQGALRAYDHLDPVFRASFDRDVASLGRLARRSCTSVLAAASRDSELLVERCFAQAQVLRKKLEHVTRTVNHGRKPRTRAA